MNSFRCRNWSNNQISYSIMSSFTGICSMNSFIPTFVRRIFRNIPGISICWKSTDSDYYYLYGSDPVAIWHYPSIDDIEIQYQFSLILLGYPVYLRYVEMGVGRDNGGTRDVPKSRSKTRYSLQFFKKLNGWTCSWCFLLHHLSVRVIYYYYILIN